MDASVTILPFSYVVDIYVLRKNIYIHIYYIFIYYTYTHMVAIMRILCDQGCMQTTVFITPLNFNFSEKKSNVINKHISDRKFFMLQNDDRCK